MDKKDQTLIVANDLRGQGGYKPLFLFMSYLVESFMTNLVVFKKLKNYKRFLSYGLKRIKNGPFSTLKTPKFDLF